jgi:hypothetical protein
MVIDEEEKVRSSAYSWRIAKISDAAGGSSADIETARVAVEHSLLNLTR